MNLFSKALIVALGSSTFGFSMPAFAAPNIATTVRDGNVSTPTCLKQAQTAAEKLRFGDVEVKTDSVAGEYQNYAVLILCHALSENQDKTAQMIIVTGDSGKEAAQIREQIKRAIDE